MGITATPLLHGPARNSVSSRSARPGTEILVRPETQARWTPNERSFDSDIRLICKEAGLAYECLAPIQRIFLTKYRCPICKLVPLHLADTTHPTRVRCGKCGNLISFRNSEKYGRLRKKIAFLYRERAERLHNDSK